MVLNRHKSNIFRRLGCQLPKNGRTGPLLTSAHGAGRLFLLPELLAFFVAAAIVVNMRISCTGKGSADFTDDLDAAGIAYQKFVPPREMVGTASDVLNIAGNASPVALAGVLAVWGRARESRNITIITKDHEVVRARDYSIKQVEQLLNNTRWVNVIDYQSLDD